MQYRHLCKNQSALHCSISTTALPRLLKQKCSAPIRRRLPTTACQASLKQRRRTRRQQGCAKATRAPIHRLPPLQIKGVAVRSVLPRPCAAPLPHDALLTLECSPAPCPRPNLLDPFLALPCPAASKFPEANDDPASGPTLAFLVPAAVFPCPCRATLIPTRNQTGIRDIGRRTRTASWGTTRAAQS
jgi:hypothetical protein